MSDRRVDLDELVGDVSTVERERLRRVHELLLEAGRPPELSPGLSEPPTPPRATIHELRHRYRYSTLIAAIVAALTVFGAGYLVGNSPGTRAERTVAMAGPGGAAATIDVFPADSAGNWPMELNVEGLPPAPAGKTYALWLTRDGKLADQCGTFAVGPGKTVVPLNAPYSLKEYSGWVVVESGSQEFVLRTATV